MTRRYAPSAGGARPRVSRVWSGSHGVLRWEGWDGSRRSIPEAPSLARVHQPGPTGPSRSLAAPLTPLLSSPMAESSSDITQLLRQLEGPEAVNLLFDRLYDELRGIAARRLQSERAGHTLSATALVNEAYVKLVDLEQLDWRNRAQFFAIAARAMRRILVNHARARSAGKRGGGARHVTLQAGMDAEPSDASLSWDEILTAEEALEELATLDERQARVVEMRLFGGLTHQEVASALDVSVPTVERDWRLGRAFLARALG